MPTYDYICPNGHRFEVVHSVTAEGPTACPICGASPVRKAFAPPTIHFKGSGWAKKDRGAAARSKARDGVTAGSGSDGGGSDSGGSDGGGSDKQTTAAGESSTKSGDSSKSGSSSASDSSSSKSGHSSRGDRGSSRETRSGSGGGSSGGTGSSSGGSSAPAD
jgi:putative FmdB family regulatory protein